MDVGMQAGDARAVGPATDLTSKRPQKEAATEIQALKVRDNTTNWLFLGRIYLVIAAAVAGAIWVISAASASQISWWWSVPATVLAIVAIGASQHQFGGAIHEGTHYILFANRKLNELASDWLAAFPILTSTYHFRLHHLAHHQFVNDPERDPDFAQLEESGHWLDFPITHVEMLWALLKQLWLPNLIRYTIARARYSALGAVHNPYQDPERTGSGWPMRIGILFTFGVPIVLIYVGDWRLAAAFLLSCWAAAVAYYAIIPEERFRNTRLVPVISHRATAIGRITHSGLIYGALSAIEFTGWGAAWAYFGLLWVLPLFTTFPLFMILRQWVQHGNADRGRYTNTRVFLAGPLVRYAVFPFGMDYHLPHHMIASVPHYNLTRLHEILLRDPEYRKKGVIVEGYFGQGGAHGGRPTAIGVLGEKYAPKQREAAYVDESVLQYADVSDEAAIARESQLSLEKG